MFEEWSGKLSKGLEALKEINQGRIKQREEIINKLIKQGVMEKANEFDGYPHFRKIKQVRQEMVSEEMQKTWTNLDTFLYYDDNNECYTC